MSAPALPRTADQPLPVEPAPPSQRTKPQEGRNRPRHASGPAKSLTTGAVVDTCVACVFCREPIEISSFTLGERQTRTTSCSNCGLVVTVAAPLWARWSRTHDSAEIDRDLADRLWARRVATTARVIIEQVALSTDHELHPDQRRSKRLTRPILREGS